MANREIQIVVPIELWREIASERETAYLLKSETMKDRLLQAARRDTGLSYEAVVEKLGVDAAAFEDHAGLGQARAVEARTELWSRRIDQEHRLVYQVRKDKIRILACRYHY